MNVVCAPITCPVLLSSACVFYEGSNLPNTGITTNNSIEEALIKIDAAFSSFSGGHIIQYNGVDLTPRTYLNFVGAGVVVTDDSGNDATLVTIAGGSSAAWGSIGAGTGVASQTDLVTYLNANYYPLASNPAGYITSAALAPYLTIVSAAATYYPLTNPANYIDGSQVPANETDPVFTAWLAGPPNVSEFTNDAGYLTSLSLQDLTVSTGLQLNSGTTYNTSAARTISIDNTVVTLTGAQALSNKTGLISQWTNDVGYLTAVVGYVPTGRNITINGNTQDLSADRTYTITTTGTLNRISVSGGSGLTPTIDIDANYVGQTSITTLGIIGTGTWQGALIAPLYGGTGLNTSASTGVAQVNAGTWSVSQTLANGTLATTQAAGTNNTSLATTAYADALVSDTAYGVSWDGVTGIAPSKNAVYDILNTISGSFWTLSSGGSLTGANNIVTTTANTLTFSQNDATVDTVLPGFTITRNTTGTAASGIGVSIRAGVEQADGSTIYSEFRNRFQEVDATPISEWHFDFYNNSATITTSGVKIGNNGITIQNVANPALEFIDNVAVDTCRIRSVAGARFEYNTASCHRMMVNNIEVTRTNSIGLGVGNVIPTVAKLHVKGIGTTTGEIVRLEDSASTNRFLMLDNGTTTITGNVTLSDTYNLSFATGTGSKIGTATTQKIGFWNATPVVQPSGWGTPTGTLARTTFDESTATLTEVAQRLAALITDLKSLGLIGT